MRRLHVTLGGFLCILTLLGLTLAVQEEQALRVITIVNISDWHGQLEPVTVTIDGHEQQVGGAAVLKSYFDQERRRNPEGTLVVTAGDAFGATPPLSSFFDDIPAIEAQNAMGFDVDTLGNHNFDYGLDRLQRLMARARFRYVAANIIGPDGQTIAPPFHLFTRHGVKVGIIGIGNPDTHGLVFPGRTGGYRFLDPAPVINQYAAHLRAQGAQIIVVLAHIGADAVDAEGLPTGRLGALAKAITGVDVLLGDHTDVSVNAMINDMIVTENRSKGTQYTVVDLTYDLRRQAIVSRTVVQKRPWVEGRSPDPSVQALIDQYQARLQPLFDRPVGETATVLSGSRQAESLLGNLVTDILRQRYQVQLAFDVSGAMRADLPSSYQPADRQLRRKGTGYTAGPPYDVVVGDFYSIFPFGNEAVTFTISGKTLWEVLEHSVSQGSIEEGQFVNTAGRFLQVSGFHYRFDPRQPVGQRVVAVTWPDGTTIPSDDTRYTAVTSAFVYHGGDGYTMLPNGSGTTRELLADTIHRAVHQMGKVTTAIEGRLSSVQAWSP
ncbi:MAG TPA: bifunctional UDP-sugar hydrolase/5'-nucleotidase [Candidatus Tectomicrobia bacterium]|nr:bifunctional UDP-sugar hydrolase/5'-nucleotidase [Candidatus Tectomicrobia bacterium]